MPYIGKVLDILSYGDNCIDSEKVRTFFELLNIKYDIDDTSLSKIINIYCGLLTDENIKKSNYDTHLHQLLSFLVESNMDITFDNLQLVLVCANMTDVTEDIYEQYHKKINDPKYLDLLYKYKVFAK